MKKQQDRYPNATASLGPPAHCPWVQVTARDFAKSVSISFSPSAKHFLDYWEFTLLNAIDSDPHGASFPWVKNPKHQPEVRLVLRVELAVPRTTRTMEFVAQALTTGLNEETPIDGVV
jgi:hypothetical protein